MICPGFIRTNISKNALVADGGKQDTMDKSTGAGMSPQKCAAKIIAGMRREKYEILVGGKETYAAYLKRFFPRILHRVVRKSAVT